MPWFTPDQWPLLKACADDAHELAPTYELWLSRISVQLSKFMARGTEVRKVTIDIGQWLEWCAGNDISPNADSRDRFVAHIIDSERRFSKSF
jgi:hypothetical protein